MPNLQYYQELAKEMCDNDYQRDRLFALYKDAWHCKWDLPAALSSDKVPHVHKVINTDPHDAIATATRVLTGKPPSVQMTPLLADEANRARANEIERNLKWQLKSTNRRRPQPVEADMLQSALTYACIASQVVDLDWQVMQLKGLGQDTRKWENLRRYSRFLVNTYNPMDVHVQYSSYMPESVLVKQMRTPRSLYNDFPWVKKLEKIAGQKEPVEYNEIWTYKERAVWVNIAGSDKDASLVLIEPQDHELPFLPWVAMMGGSTLENQAEYAYHGLLFPNIVSGKWETTNAISTMQVTEAIWNWAMPKYAEEGTAPEDDAADLSAWNPGRVVKVPMGDQLRPLQPNLLDPALSTLKEAFSGEMQRSTATGILQGGGEDLAGMAFASLNLLTLTAVGAIKPWREMAERALAEMFTLMLLWTEYSGEPLVAYGDGKQDAGAIYEIMPDEIEPESIYLDVELVPDLPTNRQAQANTAIMLLQSGLIDRESALEEMGVDDPLLVLERMELDRLTEQYQQMLMEQEAMAQQEQEQMEAQAFDQMQGGGAGFAPPQGGQPFAMMQPNATREQMVGTDNMGNPLAEEEMMP